MLVHVGLLFFLIFVVVHCQFTETTCGVSSVNPSYVTIPEFICPDGWVAITEGQVSTCVKFTARHATWDAAEAECNQDYGHLANFQREFRRFEGEFDRINNYVNSLSQFASSKIGDEGEFWTSLKLLGGTNLVWLTSSPEDLIVNFVNDVNHVDWNMIFPEVSRGNCVSARFYRSNGQQAAFDPLAHSLQRINLTMANCNQEIFGMCIREVLFLRDFSLGFHCGEGWLGSQDLKQCFRYFENRLDYSAAAAACRSQAATLASPSTGFLLNLTVNALVRAPLVNGSWCPWSEWTSCNCSTPVQRRTRTCNNPTPANDGSPCIGNSTEERPCINPLCGFQQCYSCDRTSVSRCVETVVNCSNTLDPSTGLRLDNIDCFTDTIEVESGLFAYSKGCNSSSCQGACSFTPLNPDDLFPFPEDFDLQRCTECCTGSLCNGKNHNLAYPSRLTRWSRWSPCICNNNSTRSRTRDCRDSSGNMATDCAPDSTGSVALIDRETCDAGPCTPLECYVYSGLNDPGCGGYNQTRICQLSINTITGNRDPTVFCATRRVQTSSGLMVTKDCSSNIPLSPSCSDSPNHCVNSTETGFIECQQCCSTSLCNCGPLTIGPSYCYSCNGVSLSSCLNSITTCSAASFQFPSGQRTTNASCSTIRMEVEPNFFFFSKGCFPSPCNISKSCNNENAGGSPLELSPACEECCDGDLCNDVSHNTPPPRLTPWSLFGPCSCNENSTRVRTRLCLDVMNNPTTGCTPDSTGSSALTDRQACNPGPCGPLECIVYDGMLDPGCGNHNMTRICTNSVDPSTGNRVPDIHCVTMREQMSNGLKVTRDCSNSLTLSTSCVVSPAACEPVIDTPYEQCRQCCQTPLCNCGPITIGPTYCYDCNRESISNCLNVVSCSSQGGSSGVFQMTNGSCFTEQIEIEPDLFVYTKQCTTGTPTNTTCPTLYLPANPEQDGRRCREYCTGDLCNGPDHARVLSNLLINNGETSANRRKRQVTLPSNRFVPLVWLGLRRNQNSYSWESNAPYIHSLGRHHAEPEQSCFVLNANLPPVSDWVPSACTTPHARVCQKSVKLSNGDVRISLDSTPLFTSFQISNLQLVCTVSNYHTQRDIFWYRNDVLVQNSRPPSGLTLDLRNSELYDITNTQGVYRCEAWGLDPFTKVKSQSRILLFTDIRTLKVSFYFDNEIYRRLTHSPFNLFRAAAFSLSFVNRQLITSASSYVQFVFRNNANVMTYLQSIGAAESILIDKYSNTTNNSLRVEFTAFISPINAADPREFQAGIPDGNPNVGVFTPAPSLPDESQLIPSLLSVYQQAMSESSSSSPTGFTASPSSITIRSAAGCFAFQHNYTAMGQRIRFPLTLESRVVSSTETCLSDGLPLGTALCLGDFNIGFEWGPVTEHLNCVFNPLAADAPTINLYRLSQTPTISNNSLDVGNDLVNLTRPEVMLDFKDIVYISYVVENLAAVPNQPPSIGEIIINTTDRVLRTLINDRRQAQEIGDASTRIVQAIELFGSTAQINGTLQIQRENLVLQLADVNSRDPNIVGFGNLGTVPLATLSPVKYAAPAQLDINSTDISVLIPQVAFNIATDVNPIARLVFVIYLTGDLFLTPTDLSNSTNFTRTNSKVISAAINGQRINDLSEPVITVFKPVEPGVDNRCVFWDFEAANGSGDWSSEGCTQQAMQDGRVICHCNHLTNFAILIDWHRTPIDAANTLALSIISIIGLSLSIIGLTLIILGFIIFKQLRKTRSSKVIMNLAVALLSLNIAFVAGVHRTESYGACVATAAFMHYFLLVAFSWTLIEGVLQYLRYVKVFGTYIERFMLKAALPAWILPAVLVCIVAAIDHGLYRGVDNYCWLALSAFYYAFMLPVGLVIVTNTVFFILIIKGITCDRANIRSTQSKGEIVSLQVYCAIATFLLLGLTWIFGFFSVSDGRLAFQYLFAIFNSLQGFLLFVFHNIREKTVRDAWRSLFTRFRDREERKKPYKLASSDNTNSQTNDYSSTTNTRSRTDQVTNPSFVNSQSE